MRHRNLPLITWRSLTAASIAMSMLLGILVSANARPQVNEPVSETSFSRYTRDITTAAEQGRFDSFSDHQKETNRALTILAGAERNNPVLLTDSQAERNVIIAGVARQIIRGQAPEELTGRRVLKLDLDTLFRDVKDAAQLKETLTSIVSEIEKSEAKIILFVDPLQSLVGTSAAFDATVSDFVREAIASGKLQCVGASTHATFAESIAGDERLALLFTTIEVAESTEDDEAKNEDNANGTSNNEDFTGAKISDELRQLVEAPGAPVRVNVILQFDDLKNPELRSQLAKWGVTVSSEIAGFKTLAIELPTAAVSELASANSTKYLSLDRPLKALGHVETTTGEVAMLAQTRYVGLDGGGVGVAVLDSGISSKHQSLEGRIVYSRDFTGERTTEDAYGHGTFVASMIAAKTGPYGGVAGAANLINFRVLNSRGTGSTSALLNALNAVLQYRSLYNIRVVNLSLGSEAIDSYKNDPVCRAVRQLVNAGIVVVTAAGNDGKDNTYPKLYGRIHSPGNEPSAITVGAANSFGTDGRSDDTVTTFSSRGPTRSFWTDDRGVKHYDNLMKPDLVAPGNKIIGAAAPGNRLVTENPELCVSDCGKSSTDGNMRLSGTSVSTPIVAGTVAIMLEANPRLTPNMVKAILMYTAQSLKGYNMLEQGAGELNLEGAVRLASVIRTDLSAATPVGAPLLTTSAPAAKSTIAGETFQWSQGLIFNYDWASGSELITKYQAIYGQGVLLSEGVLLSGGVMVADSTKLSRGVLLSDNILVSKGITMSDGIVLMSNGVLLGEGVLLVDGVLIGDGVLVGDGVLMGDGTLLADGRGVLIADGRGVLLADGALMADSARSLLGDNTTCMAAR